jgi:hypothetical protein
MIWRALGFEAGKESNFSQCRVDKKADVRVIPHIKKPTHALILNTMRSIVFRKI